MPAPNTKNASGSATTNTQVEPRVRPPHVSDEQITTAFLDAVHHFLASRDQVDELVDKAVRAELDSTDLHIETDQLFARVGATAETIDALIARNARIAQDQAEYQSRFDKLDIDHIEFTPYLWHTLVDHAKISVDSTITSTFRDARSQAITLKN